MSNWKLRARQKWFWVTLIPAVLLLLELLRAHRPNAEKSSR